MELPGLYPPYAINGFMVSGVGASPHDEITYPKELKEKLLDICGGYMIEIPYTTSRYSRPSLFLTDIMKLLDQNEKAIDFLIRQDVDIFVGIISATDFAQHYMWKFLDSTHPLYDKKKAEKYKPAFLQIWQRIDKIMGTVLTKVANDTNILVVSDHGFGPHKQSFYINSWLESEGYLVRKKGRSELLAKLQLLLSKIIDKTAILNSELPTLFARKSKKYAKPFLHQIDMKRTMAFAAYHATNSGKIYINTSSESPLQSSKDREKIKEQIATKLRETCNKLNMEVNIYFASDIYFGKFLHLAPDILFEINNFECSVHYKFNKFIHKTVPDNPNHSGSHRINGIFIAHGPDIKEGTQIQRAKIYDIAPTILHMFGLSVPDDMDGRVLTEIFREDSEPARRPVRYIKVSEERERIKDRIERLRRERRL
ncbi:MAG: hypothetical protein DRO62_03075 [Candidatus Altiarchaeales archaeon]|nr:MAG: hypothetical protein DRO62_03075 [Candidatus Altiarchaeales archaeon]